MSPDHFLDHEVVAEREALCLRIWWPDPDRLAGPAGR
jgi:hypothetical protein